MCTTKGDSRTGGRFHCRPLVTCIEIYEVKRCLYSAWTRVSCSDIRVANKANQVMQDTCSLLKGSGRMYLRLCIYWNDLSGGRLAIQFRKNTPKVNALNVWVVNCLLQAYRNNREHCSDRDDPQEPQIAAPITFTAWSMDANNSSFNRLLNWKSTSPNEQHLL